MLSFIFLFLFCAAIASVFFLAGHIAFDGGRFSVRRSMPIGRFAGECLSWFGMAKQTLGIVLVFVALLSAILLLIKVGLSLRVFAFTATCLLMFHLSENIFWSLSNARSASFAFALFVSGAWFFFPYWATTGIAGYCLSVFILIHLKEVSVKQALVVSFAIIIYDVSMVFASEFMIGVAEGAGTTPMGVTLPPELLFTGVAMIGLGDVILPGVLIMAAFREAKRRTLPTLPIGAVAGYFAGFALAVFARNVFNVSQPATLYLIPGALIGFWGVLLNNRIPLCTILK